MKKIIKNPLINAVLGLIIVSGFIHMSILSIQFIRSGNFNVLNYFKILDLDLFIKGIQGASSFIFSLFTAFVIYITIWYLYSRKLK